MTRRRFYAPADSFDLKSFEVSLAEDEARHLREVLRLKVDDEVYAFDGAGKEFRCQIAKVRRDSTELRILEQVAARSPESTFAIELAVALLKGDKFDLVVQKATELGVREIVPVVTRYADIHLRDEADGQKRVTRWQRIALEAAKQSGRAFVPPIRKPISFAHYINHNASATRVLFSERDGVPFDKLSNVNPRSMQTLIGSEGGWSDEELGQARAAGWHIITLGGRILRAETAAISIAAILQHRFGDLK